MTLDLHCIRGETETDWMGLWIGLHERTVRDHTHTHTCTHTHTHPNKVGPAIGSSAVVTISQCVCWIKRDGRGGVHNETGKNTHSIIVQKKQRNKGVCKKGFAF